MDEDEFDHQEDLPSNGYGCLMIIGVAVLVWFGGFYLLFHKETSYVATSHPVLRQSTTHSRRL